MRCRAHAFGTFPEQRVAYIDEEDVALGTHIQIEGHIQVEGHQKGTLPNRNVDRQEVIR